MKESEHVNCRCVQVEIPQDAIDRANEGNWGWLWFKRGATAYEAQFGRLCIRIVHLRGTYWRFRPWRRFSARLAEK